MRNELETKATSFDLHWIGMGSWVGTTTRLLNLHKRSLTWNWRVKSPSIASTMVHGLSSCNLAIPYR